MTNIGNLSFFIFEHMFCFVGCEVYAQTHIPDITTIFIDIGLGLSVEVGFQYCNKSIFVQLNLSEALAVCCERVTLLDK